MSDISVTKKHNLTQEEARKRVEKIAEDLKTKLKIDVSWRGNTCVVAGKGVKNCEITLDPGAIRFEMTLGMMLKMAKKQIEQQVVERLDKVFV